MFHVDECHQQEIYPAVIGWLIIEYLVLCYIIISIGGIPAYLMEVDLWRRWSDLNLEFWRCEFLSVKKLQSQFVYR